MAIRESGDSPVMLVGGPSALSESIAVACQNRGIAVIHRRAPFGRHLLDAAEVPTPSHDATSLESAILIVDADIVDPLFGGRHARMSRRRLRECGNAVCESAITAALAMGARRVLVICDVRWLSFGQGLRAERWIRDLAHRIGYEGSINGLTGLATSYTVVDTDQHLQPIAHAVADWHRGEMLPGAAGLGTAAAGLAERLA
ncbi:hypothetical protein QGN32_08775 [Mycolicibacterium sp. ND9-15]|uniref:hypothetical protein n=1 Tax=Mycolicibacterium sp. ND9-15 TaxID=3042320 RepID=UPI002DD7CB99|nr:hypothetical protein [Mycolicibacterium sp. ND9-15]WSE57921.1 hypothetical protein QGN32_08775 [Mycolicibacterium sp. ND9-15]